MGTDISCRFPSVGFAAYAVSVVFSHQNLTWIINFRRKPKKPEIHSSASQVIFSI